ncbi:MAG TPA: hypothetical protein VL049_23345 [Candidatus Dormibacteraeota bacterium]|nr:hypothetical protein [Candidatus Dormibacteraeota bacterium]
MACHCHAQPKTESTALAEEAMWALALSATRRSTGALPSEFRGMSPEDALTTLRPTGPYGASKGWAVFGMMFMARGLHSRAPSQLLALEPLVITPDQLPLLFTAMFASIFDVSTLAAGQFLTALGSVWDAGASPCGWPSSVGTYNASSGDVSLTSRVVVFRPLQEVAPLLDPRRWDECSDLFKRTCRVAEPPGCDPRCIDPNRDNRIGSHWKGIVYERAAVGPHEAENLLSVVFDSPTRSNRRVHLDFSLYRSISYRLGAWETPGLFRRDSGELTAIPIKHDIPGGQTNADCTDIVVSKAIRYGRTSTWSGSSIVDYGELCNYLAPAFLTLWIANIQLIVPCCPGKGSPARREGR